MRQEAVAAVVKRMRVVVSRRAGLALGFWGEPGVGKTHLVTSVLRDLACASVSLRATAADAVLAGVLRDHGAAPAWAVAVLQRVAAGGHAEGRALAEALAAVLAARAPTVLHLEDVHEADPARVELIVRLAELARRSPGVGVVATGRLELPRPFRNERVEPLGFAELLAILEREARSALPPEAAAWIFERTRGNPLFALEYLRFLRRQGSLWSDEGQWRWRAPERAPLPASVEALISGLIAGAGSGAAERSALEARAMLPEAVGEERLAELWAAAAGIAPGELEAACRGLERSGVLRGGDFVHPLFREVLARDLLPERRRELARRIVRLALESDVTVAADLVAAADLGAGEASGILLRAARVAEERGHAPQAGRWLAQASELLQGEERAATALAASRLLRNHEIGLATRLARLALDLRADLASALSLAELLVVQGEAEPARELLAGRPAGERASREWWEGMLRVLARGDGNLPEVLRMWSERPDYQAVAAAATVQKVANALSTTGQPAAGKALLERLLARPGLSERDRTGVLHDLALAAFYEGDYRAAEARLVEAIALDRRLDLPYSLAETLRKLASLYVRQGRHAEALELLREAEHLAVAGGHARVYAIVLGTRGTLLAQVGDFLAAESALTERCEIMERAGSAFYRFDAHADLALLYLEWGPPHGSHLALLHGRVAVHWARVGGRGLGMALAQLARAELEAGDPARALACAREAVAGGGADSPEDRAWARLALGVVLCAAGERAEGEAALREGREAFAGLGIIFWEQRAELELDRVRWDAAALRQREQWFAARGLHGGSHVARRALALAGAPGERRPPAVQARLKVLGPVGLEVEGNPVPYRGRKRGEILAYLLEARVSGRDGASQLELLDAVYPGVPEAEGRATLKQQVYLIRAALGADAILSTAGGYALGAVSSDAEDFLRYADPGLWRGQYLQGLAVGWHPGVRDAMAVALVACIEGLLTASPAEAARLARILCEMEPYDLAALRLAVEAVAAGGGGRDLARFYDAARERFAEIGERLPETVAEFRSSVPAAPPLAR